MLSRFTRPPLPSLASPQNRLERDSSALFTTRLCSRSLDQVNPLDAFFRTPLFIASALEFLEIQKMLIAVGGMVKDPFAITKDKAGATCGREGRSRCAIREASSGRHSSRHSGPTL